MADVSDILLKHWEDQRAKSRHSEDQRATLTNMILVLSSLGFALIGQRGLRDPMLAVTIPLIALGAYGALATAKLAERATIHNRQGREFADRLDELMPELRLKQTYAAARESHRAEYGKLARLRLRHLWTALHGGIATAGLVLTAVILLK
ncbi:hypothetical protein [Actinomadura macrotermitis]|uniref:Uncharacterized protein n=1 Tax=Actinomadura macrotermitis TaxID=2585200 RepID=A0A7K0BQN9_9ACTN|nr:hypothetical protein [Actinomadura macrotermitis]MQY03490.1 hypothetical protein [Actinomadura macrotermitis]